VSTPQPSPGGGEREVVSARGPLRLALIAILTSLTAVVTIYLRIPIPATQGYFNLGDILVMFSGFALGPTVGLIAGGVGSGIADLVGFPLFAPMTTVIKGFEGFLCGALAVRRSRWRMHAVGALAGAWIVTGYFAVEVYLFGVGAALVELPFNVLQGVSGLVVAPLLVERVRRAYPRVERLAGAFPERVGGAALRLGAGAALVALLLAGGTYAMQVLTPLEFGSEPPLTAQVGVQYEYAFSPNFPAEAVLSTNASWLTMDDANATLVGTPTIPGSYWVELSLSWKGKTAEQNFTIIVQPES